MKNPDTVHSELTLENYQKIGDICHVNKLFKFPPLSNTDNMQFSYKINKLSLSMSNKAVLNAKLDK